MPLTLTDRWLWPICREPPFFHTYQRVTGESLITGTSRLVDRRADGARRQVHPQYAIRITHVPGYSRQSGPLCRVAPLDSGQDQRVHRVAGCCLGCHGLLFASVRSPPDPASFGHSYWDFPLSPPPSRFPSPLRSSHHFRSVLLRLAAPGRGSHATRSAPYAIHPHRGDLPGEPATHGPPVVSPGSRPVHVPHRRVLGSVSVPDPSSVFPTDQPPRVLTFRTRGAYSPKGVHPDLTQTHTLAFAF